MKLGQGAAQGIRNLSTHDLGQPDEEEALEMLAVLSYVARLVDRAEALQADGDAPKLSHDGLSGASVSGRPRHDGSHRPPITSRATAPSRPVHGAA
jgi:hypothetical protein